MIESIRIITGTPKEVESKTTAALAAHPKAEVLSSALDVTTTEDPETKKQKTVTTVMVVVGNRF